MVVDVANGQVGNRDPLAVGPDAELQPSRWSSPVPASTTSSRLSVAPRRVTSLTPLKYSGAGEVVGAWRDDDRGIRDCGPDRVLKLRFSRNVDYLARRSRQRGRRGVGRRTRRVPGARIADTHTAITTTGNFHRIFKQRLPSRLVCIGGPQSACQLTESPMFFGRNRGKSGKRRGDSNGVYVRFAQQLSHFYTNSRNYPQK